MGCGGGSGFNRIDNAIRPGARKVFCVKFQREMEGLDEVPFEGHPLGQKIFENVSKEAWQQWQRHQTMLVNENRLNLSDARARQYLRTQLEEYFFGSGSDLPTGYVPPRD